MYNNGFPVTYPQVMYPNIQQPPQGMTPPMIHADIVQVNGEQEAMSYPVAAGTTQMMIDRDDSAIYIKTAYANSEPMMEVYRKEEKKFTPAEQYVTKEELEELIRELKEEKK